MIAVAIINGHMLDVEPEPGEHLDWSKPDIETREGWHDILNESVEEYAAANPHMIVFEVAS